MSLGLLPRQLPLHLVRIGRLHPRLVVAFAVVAWVAAGLLASRVEVETDILSLVLSHYPGLRSVGAAAILGALSTAILGITLLPALLSMRED